MLIYHRHRHIDLNLTVTILDIIHRPGSYLKTLRFRGLMLSSFSGAVRRQKQVFFCWANLCRFHQKMETEYSLQNIVFKIKDRTMDNVQKYVYIELTSQIINLKKLNSVI
jgi:hypothetical protein